MLLTPIYRNGRDLFPVGVNQNSENTLDSTWWLRLTARSIDRSSFLRFQLGQIRWRDFGSYGAAKKSHQPKNPKLNYGAKASHCQKLSDTNLFSRPGSREHSSSACEKSEQVCRTSFSAPGPIAQQHQQLLLVFFFPARVFIEELLRVLEPSAKFSPLAVSGALFY